MTDLSSLCFTDLLHALLVTIGVLSTERPHWLLARKEVYRSFLQQFLVSEKQTLTSCHSIHVLVLISILIYFCCCSWHLICPCITLTWSSPSAASSSLAVTIITVQEPVWDLGSSSREQVRVDIWQYCDFKCVRYQKCQNFCLSILHCNVMSVTAVLPYPVLCMLWDLIWSFAVPSHPPEPLPLLFSWIPPVTCLTSPFVMREWRS